MSELLLAAGLLGLGCMCCGGAVAAVCTVRPRPPAAPWAEPSGTADRPSFGLARLRPLAPVAGAAAGLAVAAVPGALAGALAGIAVPRISDRRRAGRRAALLEDQLAEAVSSLAAGVRAGLSLARAIAFAADEADQPLAASLTGAAERIDLGVPLELALHEWATDTRSADARLLAGVLELHHRTGGELPVVLDNVATTLRERRASAREVRALTAQARLSGAILGLLPIGFFLFLSITSRDDIAAAFHSSAGLAAITLGFTMQGFAFLWIRSLLRVDG